MSFFKKLFGKKSDPQDWRQITENLAHAISQALHTKTDIAWGTSPAETRIISMSPGGSTMSTFVGNIMTRCQAQPEDVAEIFREHIETLSEDMRLMDSGQSLDTAKVLPLIKPLEWLHVAQKQLQAAGATAVETDRRFIRTPLPGDLLVVYVIDTEHGMSYIGETEAAELGLSDTGELHATALNNLRKKLGEASFEGGGGRYAIRLDNNYDASLALLIDDILPHVQINGRPVMAIPSRDELLICGDQDAESVQSLREVAGEIFAANAYTISKKLYAWQNGTIVPL